jgi:hypothetical protein
MKKEIDGITFISDCKEKLFLYRHEVPEKVLKDQFSHLDDIESDTFLKYRGYYYHISDFMLVAAESKLQPWEGYISDSFFSGVLIRLPEYKTETYIIGRYYC